ncbi:glycosyltransferase [Nonlabens ulvanivorans]|nr:glycosyltransferase family 4 protein [Nonlabens ulvanivorans]GAK89369.1 glycosyltransferase [Nonlabens ulvanivorans]
MNKTIVVVPTDPVKAYDRKGTSGVVKRIYNPNNYFDEVIILSPFEDEEFVWEGLKVIPTKTYVEFQKHLKRINPLFVRVYGSYHSCTFAIHARLLKYPVVVSIHDDRDSFIHDSIKYADRILAVSDVLKDILIVKGVKKNKITVIGNRIDYSTFKPLEGNSHNSIVLPKGRNILHIGKKTNQKNLDNVIKALTFLPKDVNLIAIGRGDDSVYQEIAEEYGVEKRLVLKQFIPNHELNNLYNSCEVFCVPSRNEGFGVVFIEAAAAGSKMVTSNKKPMSDILPREFKNVFLVDNFESPEDLAKSINQALAVRKSDVKSDAIRLRGIHKEKYSFEAVATKEVSVYQNYQAQTTGLSLFIKSKVFTTISKLRQKFNH